MKVRYTMIHVAEVEGHWGVIKSAQPAQIQTPNGPPAKSKQTTYGLAIPYYKLIIFKVDEKHYTINFEDHFLKIRVKNKSDHKFFFKISEIKSLPTIKSRLTRL